MASTQLITAAAGSGKTTMIVDEALAASNAKVLITTFTENNVKEIRERFVERCGFVPLNITVQAWFSFLLQHGVRPYQNCLYEPDTRGMILVNIDPAPRTLESDVGRHYMNADRKLYSDKIAKFTFKCNENAGGSVFKRLSKIYSHIFIDEAQDLGGWDLEIVEILAQSPINLTLVGDPRQRTYETHLSKKNSQHSKNGETIFEYYNLLNGIVVRENLNKNHRCVSQICKLADGLFPNLGSTTSGNTHVTEHDGVFLVKRADLNSYLDKYKPMQLRNNKTCAVEEGYDVMNFGESKGLSFDRVLIFPTKPIKKWLKNRAASLPATSQAKLYVAITRARQSVAFVYDYKECENIEGCQKVGSN